MPGVVTGPAPQQNGNQNVPLGVINQAGSPVQAQAAAPGVLAATPTVVPITPAAISAVPPPKQATPPAASQSTAPVATPSSANPLPPSAASFITPARPSGSTPSPALPPPLVPSGRKPVKTPLKPQGQIVKQK